MLNSETFRQLFLRFHQYVKKSSKGKICKMPLITPKVFFKNYPILAATPQISLSNIYHIVSNGRYQTRLIVLYDVCFSNANELWETFKLLSLRGKIPEGVKAPILNLFQTSIVTVYRCCWHRRYIANLGGPAQLY